jgi:hypothetical protein
MNAEAALQLLAMTSAQAEPDFVFEEYLVFAVFVEGKAVDAIEVDDGGAVDATEDSGIEILFEFGYAAAQHVSALADVEAGVVVGGFDPIYFGDF